MVDDDDGDGIFGLSLGKNCYKKFLLTVEFFLFFVDHSTN